MTQSEKIVNLMAQNRILEDEIYIKARLAAKEAVQPVAADLNVTKVALNTLGVETEETVNEN